MEARHSSFLGPLLGALLAIVAFEIVAIADAIPLWIDLQTLLPTLMIVPFIGAFAIFMWQRLPGYAIYDIRLPWRSWCPRFGLRGMDEPTTKPIRRFLPPRFGLRTLFVVVTVASVGLGVLGYRRAEFQRRALYYRSYREACSHLVLSMQLGIYEHYADQEEKYRKAANAPWLTVQPDQPEPDFPMRKYEPPTRRWW